MKVTPIRFVRTSSSPTGSTPHSGWSKMRQRQVAPGQTCVGPGASWAFTLPTLRLRRQMVALWVLQFKTEEKLESTVARVLDAGYTPSDIMDETFGRYVTVEDPDGYLIQINEIDEEFSSLSYETRESSALK